MPKPNLVGGSEGEPEKFSSHPFFHRDVKAVKLLSKNTYGLRILPAFNFDLDPSDPAFQHSYAPYRDAAQVDNSSGSERPKFNSWYFILKGYEFLGNEGRSFLSPLTEFRQDRRGVDPLFDIFFTARNSGNADWVALATKPESKDVKAGGALRAVIPMHSKYAALNVIMDFDGSLENRIVTMSTTGLDVLKERLNMLRPASQAQPIDPEWPDFLLGDVTSPIYGAWGTAKKEVFNTANMATSIIGFSAKKDQLVGHVPWPLDLSENGWGWAFLQARQNIGDLEKVTHMWTGEEILQFIVDDGFIPYELVQKACAQHWQIPPENTNTAYSLPNAEDDGGGSFGSRPAAPAAPVVQPARPAAQPARPAAVTPPAPRTPAGPSAPGRVVTPAAPVAAQPPVSQRPAAQPARPAAAAPTTGPVAPRPGGAPKPPGGAPAPRPPAPQPRVSAPAPVAPPPDADAPVETSTELPPLNDAEMAEFTSLQNQFLADPSQLTPAEVQRYGELGDRYSATAQM